MEIKYPSGRELDALIAERVMGWSDISHNDVAWYGRPPIGHSQHQFMTIDLPHYSTDIAAVWQAVEVVMGLPPYCLVLEIEKCDGDWYAEFRTPADEFAGISGDSAPHAICLAALEVVENG